MTHFKDDKIKTSQVEIHSIKDFIELEKVIFET